MIFAASFAASCTSTSLTRGLYSTDASPFQITPLAVAVPDDADDVAVIVRYCFEHNLPADSARRRHRSGRREPRPGRDPRPAASMHRILGVEWRDDRGRTGRDLRRRSTPNSRSTAGGSRPTPASGRDLHHRRHGRDQRLGRELRSATATRATTSAGPRRSSRMTEAPRPWQPECEPGRRRG